MDLDILLPLGPKEAYVATGRASVPQNSGDGRDPPTTGIDKEVESEGYRPEGEVAMEMGYANVLIFFIFLLAALFFGLAQWMGYNPFTDGYGLFWIAIPFAFLIGGNATGTYKSEKDAEARAKTKMALAICAFIASFAVWLFPLFMGA